MAYRTSSYGGGFGALGGGLTPWVRRLLIANTAVAVALLLLSFTPLRGIGSWLAFDPADFFTRPWTLLTYGFVHLGPFHLLGNLLVLFFFGPRLEDHWGGRDFLRVYLFAVLAGALASFLLFAVQPAGYIIGASAGTLGLLTAYGMLWPEDEVHIWGIFPIRVKWLVLILAAVNLWMAVGGGGQGVAVLAHLGGMLGTFLLLRSPWKPRGWGNLPSRPRKGGSGPVRSAGSAIVSWIGGRAGRSGEDRAPAPVASATRPPPRSARSRQAERDLLEDVDRILDKISEKGIASLTDEERKRLDEVSRQRRSN
jgi:membrane associated rhomboid family serine protease